ncbi:carboxypeptidase-like regulatory domain-containing protein [Myxococcaceae bacterium GXIMD 01537]
MKKKLVVALVPFLAVGCGEELKDENKDGIADGINKPGSVTSVAPATPMGTVSGQVLSTRYTGLEGVEVTVTIGSQPTGLKATTDAGGFFNIKDVPAGSRVLVSLTKSGYVTARSWADVPSSAGNVPINNANASFGPVVMAETSGTVKFLVVTPTGRPAVGAKATMHVSRAAFITSDSSNSIDGQVVVQAEADAQGILTFTGIPAPEEGARIGTNYQLFIASQDTNGDGIPDVDGYINNYSGYSLTQGSLYNTFTIQLPSSYQNTALGIRYSSLGRLSGLGARPQTNMVRPGEPIYIVFNQPVQPNSLVVGLTDEYGKESLTINKTLSNNNTLLTLTPGQTISAGHEYNLTLHAAPVTGTTDFDTTIPFFGGDLSAPQAIAVATVKFQDLAPIAGANPPPFVNGRLDPGEEVSVNFNQVMGRIGPGFTLAQVFFSASLDNNSTLSFGELGFNSGFTLDAAEPVAPIQTKTPAETPVFPIGFSGYTTRFKFTYQGANPLDPTFAATAAAPIVIAFSKVPPASTTYESAWGVPQTTDVLVTSISAIPPPTP